MSVVAARVDRTVGPTGVHERAAVGVIGTVHGANLSQTAEYDKERRGAEWGSSGFGAQFKRGGRFTIRGVLRKGRRQDTMGCDTS